MAYVRTRLGRLYYLERGSRLRPSDPTIVLLHGLLFDGGMWRHQVESLAALGRVLVFDGPGHGKSEPPPRFTLEEHADALLDAFHELGATRVVLIGLSWGGMVGMRFALQHAESTAGMALLDSSAESPTLAERARYRALIGLHRRLGMPFGLFRSEVAPRLFGPRALEREDLVVGSYQRVAGFDRAGVARAARAVIVDRSNVLPSLARVRVPTLVLCGRDDRSTPPEKSENIARAIPQSKLILLDGVGHMSALEDPAAVNEHVIPFARDVLSP